MVLSLDISTSITGYAIIDENGKVHANGSIDLRKEKSFVKKVQLARNTIMKDAYTHKPNVVAVEENLQGFRRGFSSAATLNTLARFNGALSFAMASFLDVPLVNISVSNIRKTLGMKLKREKDCGISTKEQVKTYIDMILEESSQSIQWETRVLKSGPRKGQCVLCDDTYDRVDAIAVGLAYLKIGI
tara:strand:+ start:1705 stop:2265 length:561 start_codon:yes stop_codon:yes gene_type:complete